MEQYICSAPFYQATSIRQMKKLVQKELDTMLATERTELEDFIDEIHLKYKTQQEEKRARESEYALTTFFYTDPIILHLPVEQVRRQVEETYGHLLLFNVEKVMGTFLELQRKFTKKRTNS